MTTTHVPFTLTDPARKVVSARAAQALQALRVARTRLVEDGYEQIRFDQYQHPATKVMVETGYTYGETRLVVHEPHSDYVSPVVTDFRLVGGEHHAERLNTFLQMVADGALV